MLANKKVVEMRLYQYNIFFIKYVISCLCISSKFGIEKRRVFFHKKGLPAPLTPPLKSERFSEKFCILFWNFLAKKVLVFGIFWFNERSISDLGQRWYTKKYKIISRCAWNFRAISALKFRWVKNYIDKYIFECTLIEINSR